MEQIRPQASVLSYWRYPGISCIDLYAELTCLMDCCRNALDNGCIDKHIDGAIQSFCWRYAAIRTTNYRFCNPKLLYWHRGRHSIGSSICSYKLVPYSEYCTGRANSIICKTIFLYWRCSFYLCCYMDNNQDKRVFSR